ncbi:unnamed protein product [Mytilus edulis]|uniref:Endonuclease-reverse transcriptase n=1 Tax=Mytilus edulis TaxID=6550 RepID=A0A8S3SG78_MYTED|nr:unnamed protein product [Mytilus edulis]
MSQVSISKEAEMITGKIKMETKQYIITSFYRPPNKTDSKYVEKTITEIQNLRNNNKRSTFLLGGNSDHDIVLVDISANVNKPKPSKRKIYLWKKADLESIGKHLDSQFDTFKKTNFDDINNMWTSIKQIIKDSMEKHVPTKTSLARQSHPWMNTQLRRLSKQKQRAYSKAKLTNSTKDWKRYKNIKAELQRESRRAHTKFMQNIVSDDLYKNPKRFWSYIKSRKQESSGITTLKNKDGYLHSDTPTKAAILNTQFHSVYTQEDLNESISNHETNKHQPEWCH